MLLIQHQTMAKANEVCRKVSNCICEEDEGELEDFASS